MSENTLDLSTAIESISVSSEISPEMVVSSLSEVIKEEISDYLDVLDEDIEVTVNETMCMSLFLRKKVCEEKQHPILDITSTEVTANGLTPNEEGIVLAPFSLNLLSRRDIKSLNQKLIQRLRGLKNVNLYEEYKAKEGSLVSGTFLRKVRRDMIINLGNTEGKLSYRDQPSHERYRQGSSLRVLIKEVSFENDRLNILLSRTDPNFIIRLFENEVSEMASGIVKVKAIVREVGRKTKMAVYSNKSDVEPVGACVGLYGNRIKAVMKELGTERIDVIPHSSNIKQYIARALDADSIKEILLINRVEKEALVIVDDESYPIVIGKNGVNVKLASRLVGWEISIRRESQINKHPGMIKVFSKIDDLFNREEEDLAQLTDIDEADLVKIMRAGITTVADLYEKSLEEIATIEGIGIEKASKIRQVLDDMVELVEEDSSTSNQVFGAQAKSETVEEESEEQEIQQLEFLVCPSCNFEFEYSGEDACPNCKSEFEFEEES